MDMLKIAIPNKGRLSEKIYDLLSCAGLVFPLKDDRTLQVITKDKKYSIIFLRTQDIPMIVENGIADIGFTGFDILTEVKSEVNKVMDLDFGYCEMVVAVKEEDSYQTPDELPQNLKIATSFPNIAKEYFEKLGKNPKIIEVSGATEITPRLGLSDAVVDITSSGTTLKSNKLRIIDKILESNAIVISNKNLNEIKQEKTQIVLRALKSVIDARQKKYLMAHVPKSSLEEIRSFLPGLASPTIMTLAGDDKHVVMHVVVDADKVFDSIDRLKKLGGQGILIMTVDQMVR
ncbi:MAG: ATP phosphoribosyltransferase [Candidatus Gastranaerophilales bacterium]|nr:ATP phosphoribosyltransferase [Candidatus Gastranaerophilales bacterium]